MLNPNCSEVVFRLGKLTREQVLEELKKIGIIEVEVPANEYYEWSSDDDDHYMLGDKDNPNIPDWKCHASLNLYPRNSDDPASIKFVKRVVRALTPSHVEESLEEVMPIYGEKFGIALEKVLDLMDGKIKTNIDRIFMDELGITKEQANESYYSNTFHNIKELYELDVDLYVNDKRKRKKILREMASMLKEKKSIEEMGSYIENKYPELARHVYYIMGHQHYQHQLFPTMKKIDDHFGYTVMESFGGWSGYDGGGIGDYENWLDELKIKGTILEMLGEGKEKDEILAFLKSKFPYDENEEILGSILEMKPEERTTALEIPDYQDEVGKAKREKYCKFN